LGRQPLGYGLTRLDWKRRLCYTVVAEGEGVKVVVLEVFQIINLIVDLDMRRINNF